ncbi:MAG: hypothetical protein Q4D56_00145 [Bacteroides sp.]|nr:hypothetical protein [Bacteroides sp.]
MMKLVHELLETVEVPTACLQRINESLLKDYKLSFGGFLTVYPKEVEAYYVNRLAKRPFVDENAQCMLDPKTNDEIRELQSGRFGKLYMHRKGLGGMDICLSDSDSYVLCCTIKAAEVNGEECWSPLKVRNAVLDAILTHDGLLPDRENRLKLMDRINGKNAVSVLNPRETPLTGEVYHQRRRGLRRRDKMALLPLRSFMDLWNKNLQMGNVQKINLYMSIHPGEDVLDVLRRNQFRYIPAEIRARYKIDRKVKLYV